MTASAPPRPHVGGESGFVLTAAAIAEAVGGELAGDAEVVVSGIAPLDRATRTDLTFLAVAKYATLFESTKAGVVLIAPDLVDSRGDVPARIVVDRPHEALLNLLARLHRPPVREPGVSASAVIGRGARIGSNVRIGPFVVIGDGATIGDGVTLEAHATVGAGVEVGAGSHIYESATLYSGAVLGKRVIIHAGARIASDGFGYVFRDREHAKIPHVGKCLIGDDVEIGANTAIDRGSIDDTVIGAGTKIDNLVHVAHNVRIGRLCLIMAQVGIAGSVRIEDGCVLAGQVGVSGHHTVGAGARLAAQAGVFGDIPAGETWSGYPARPHKDALRSHAALFKLSKLVRRIEALLEREDKVSTQ